MEGRDIGSVVVPDASLKLYLVAHPTERAGRRADERDEATESVEESMVVRDTQDAQTNPFVPASDATQLDTTDLSADDVLQRALELARERGVVR
jgi:cytidylate kinase